MPPTLSIAAGELRHRVDLQRNDAGDADVSGQPVTPHWVAYTTRWAKVEPLIGRELFNAQQVNAQVSVRVTLRPDGLVGPDAVVALAETHRVLFKGRVLNIAYLVNREETGERLEAYCTEPK